MVSQLIKTPVILFLYLSVVLTQSSIFFPQNIGRFRKVSGWPLSMYEVEYKRISDIKVTGEIVHQVVETGSILMWEKVFFNIIFWTGAFYGVWFIHRRLNRVKSSRV